MHSLKLFISSKLFLNAAAVSAMFLCLPRLQAQSPQTPSVQLQGSGGSLQIPSGWSARQYANVHELRNATPQKLAALSADEDEDIPRVNMNVTPTANHAEALHRLLEIEAEWGMTSSYTVIGGWPALQRTVLVPKPTEGDDRGSETEYVIMVTTAVADGASVVRVDGFAPEKAATSVVNQMRAIGSSYRPASPGDAGQASGEAQQLRNSPSLRMPPPAAAIASAGANANAQPATPQVSSNTPAQVTNLGTSNLRIGSESEIAVSANGTNIVVTQQCGFANSADGGATFPTRGNYPSTATQRCTGGDSSVAFGKSGNFYWSTIGSNASCPSTNKSCNNTQNMALSTNNGQSFTFLTNVFDCLNGTSCGFGGVPDQEHMAADRVNASSSGKDQLYLVFRKAFGFGISCSTDSGSTWGAVAFFNNGSTDFPRITVGQDGTVYVVTNNGNNIELDSFSSCQNGLTHGLNHVTIASGINGVTCPVSGLDRCNDGNTLSSHTVAVDDTNANHLYAAYAVNTVAPPSNKSFPGNENILVRESTNGGSTWSGPVTINGGTSGTGGRRFQPWVCATGGTAFVSWFDRRASTSGSNDLTDYYAGSATAGPTAGSEFKVDGTADPECASGWPCASRSKFDSESCSTQPQFGGQCRHSPNNNTDSFQACNFASPTCTDPTETCQTGSGCPKYADYTGSACVLGRLYNVWPSATNQPGAVSTGGSINSFFAETVVAKTPTTTTYTGPVTAPFLGTVSLSATLVLTGTSIPVASQAITFTIGTQACVGTTTSLGVATCNIVLTQPAGPYTVVASFAASGNYLASSASSPFIIVAPPAITKNFGPSKILPGGITNLSFSITNPNTSVSLTGVGFADTLPAGLLVAIPNGLTSNCGGSASAPPGGGTITLSGVTISAAGACTIAVNVVASNVDGIRQNTSSRVTSINGGNGNMAMATVIVAHPPTLTKTFSALAIPQGASTKLTLTLVDPNQNVSLTGVAFSDILPTGLVVSTPNGLATTCSGTVTATAGGTTISASGVPLSAPGGSCTINLFVTAIASGVQINTTGAPTSDQTVPGSPATATITVGDVFEVSYAANLSAGDGQINISNSGFNGAMLNGPGIGNPAGNICVNVYAFSPDEQLISCCACLVTPNGLESLSIDNDIVSNTLTGVKPNSIVVKLVSTLAGAGGSGLTCTNSAAAPTPLAPGLQAWSTSLHAAPAGGFDLTEIPFTESTLSAAELASIANRCANIIGNGSSFGICKSCRAGSLGGERQ